MIGSNMTQRAKKITVNGLTKENIVDMYSFVYEFENIIKAMKKDSQVKNAYPDVKNIIKSNKSLFYKNVIWKKRGELNGINKDDTKINNCIYCTLSQNTVFLSFLRHLRNSFCHSKMVVKENDKIYYLEDEYNGNKSMIGNIKKEYLQKIIDSIIRSKK